MGSVCHCMFKSHQTLGCISLLIQFNTIPLIAENAEIILPVNDPTDWQSQIDYMPLQRERIRTKNGKQHNIIHMHHNWHWRSV